MPTHHLGMLSRSPQYSVKIETGSKVFYEEKMTKSNDQDNFQTRRELLRSAVRILSLGGISALCLIAKIRIGAPGTGDGCINQGICGPCGVFDKCSLPQALSAKEGLARQQTYAQEQE